MKYTPSMKLIAFKKVLKELEKGTPLRRILDTPGMPSRRMFYDWIDESEDLRKRYARAKELAAEALFDRMVEIAETPVMGDETTVKPFNLPAFCIRAARDPESVSDEELERFHEFERFLNYQHLKHG